MKILITGITGQDGIFLTKLIQKSFTKFNILGISRSMNASKFMNKFDIKNLKRSQSVSLVNLNLLNYESVNKLVGDFIPDLVFNLSGPSSVYESIKNPNIEDEINLIFDNLTNVLIQNKNLCNFFQASTSEMYGKNNQKEIYNEEDEFIPNSPYASGKLTNHNKVLNLAETHNWKIFSGILFNHESEYREEDYLFTKIMNSALKIKSGDESYLTVGSLDYCRDWSYAKEIIEGVFLMTTEGKRTSYVLGSGVGTTIGEIIKIVFDFYDLNYEDHIKLNPEILRKGDPVKIISNPHKINSDLRWETKLDIETLVEKIIKVKMQH